MAKHPPVRLGVLGMGRAGWFMFSNEIKGRDHLFKVVCGCDRIAERRRLFAERFACRTVSRPADLLADPSVELVYIATRSHDHYRHAVEALEAGKHVFVEKPMGTDHAQAVRLQRLAARSKGRLLVRHNRRFEPCFQHVREIIDSGILGDVFSISLCRSGYGRRADWQTLRRFGGGQLLNWGPHIVDHALQLLDAPVKNVWSHNRLEVAGGDSEDHALLTITATNQRVAHIELSGATALPQPEYLVLGRKGALSGGGSTLTLRYLDPRRAIARAGRPPVDPGTPVASYGNGPGLPWIEKTIPVAPRKKVDLNTIWLHVFQTLRAGVPFPITLDQAVEVMRVLSLAGRDKLYRAGA